MAQGFLLKEKIYFWTMIYKAAKIRDLVLVNRLNTKAHNIEMQSDELGFEAQLGSFFVCFCLLLWLSDYAQNALNVNFDRRRNWQMRFGCVILERKTED